MFTYEYHWGIDEFAKLRGLTEWDVRKANRTLSELYAFIPQRPAIKAAPSAQGEEDGDVLEAAAKGDEDKIEADVDEADSKYPRERCHGKFPLQTPEDAVAAEKAAAEKVVEDAVGSVSKVVEDAVAVETAVARAVQKAAAESRSVGAKAKSRGSKPSLIRQLLEIARAEDQADEADAVGKRRRIKSESVAECRGLGVGVSAASSSQDGDDNKSWCKTCNTPFKECYKPGDWFCPDCQRHNYASKKQCSGHKCPSTKAPRNDTWCRSCMMWRSVCVKPGDWLCKVCDNHNYQKKSARACTAVVYY